MKFTMYPRQMLQVGGRNLVEPRAKQYWYKRFRLAMMSETKIQMCRQATTEPTTTSDLSMNKDKRITVKDAKGKLQMQETTYPGCVL